MKTEKEIREYIEAILEQENITCELLARAFFGAVILEDENLKTRIKNSEFNQVCSKEMGRKK